MQSCAFKVLSKSKFIKYNLVSFIGVIAVQNQKLCRRLYLFQSLCGCGEGQGFSWRWWKLLALITKELGNKSCYVPSPDIKKPQTLLFRSSSVHQKLGGFSHVWFGRVALRCCHSRKGNLDAQPPQGTAGQTLPLYAQCSTRKVTEGKTRSADVKFWDLQNQLNPADNLRIREPVA